MRARALPRRGTHAAEEGPLVENDSQYRYADPMHNRGRAALALLAAIIGVAVTACGSTSPSTARTESSRAAIDIVTSTTVWANIAEQLADDHAHVTALIADQSRDPHDFQPSGRDELAVSRADLVIENGGGYDDVVTSMYRAVSSTAPLLSAFDIAKDQHLTDGDNEHIWMSIRAVDAVASTISTHLEELDPQHRAEYRSRRDTLSDSLSRLSDRIAAVRADHCGATALVTESLADYLLRDLGLVNITPRPFADAIEDGIAVTPTQLHDVLGALKSGAADVVIDNVQSADPQSERVVAEASTLAIPVVRISELMDAKTSYQQWMSTIISHLDHALEDNL